LPILILSIFAYREREISRQPILFTEASDESLLPRATLAGGELRFVIPVPPGARVDGIRIQGSPAVPFHATVAGEELNFSVRYLGRELAPYREFLPAGDPGVVVISFINEPIIGLANSSVIITVRKPNLDTARPDSVSLLRLDLAVGAGLKRIRQSVTRRR
jgi:hypothetical protein